MANELSFERLVLPEWGDMLPEFKGVAWAYPPDECSVHKLPLTGNEELSVILKDEAREVVLEFIRQRWQN